MVNVSLLHHGAAVSEVVEEKWEKSAITVHKDATMLVYRSGKKSVVIQNAAEERTLAVGRQRLCSRGKEGAADV